jgi:hypothetical protein
MIEPATNSIPFAVVVGARESKKEGDRRHDIFDGDDDCWR